MKITVAPEIKEIIGAVHYRPAVSVIMPFEPKMTPKKELMLSLKLAIEKVEKEINENYPDELSGLVIQKLNAIIKSLNFSTYKKSIAIYVSPVFEKLLYLDIPVEEKIIIDESFEIRDLVYCKKPLHKYLVLLLSLKESKIFLGNSNGFAKIVSNTPELLSGYIRDVPQRVANFSDPKDRKGVMMENFLNHIDNNLDIILNAYHLPLFVLGTKRILGHFNKLTKHKSAVIEYIHGNYEKSTLDELKNILLPHTNDWKKIVQKDLLNQMEEAASHKKLATGIRAVWQEAMHQKGRLLVVEKNYMYPAQQGSPKEIIYSATQPYTKYSYIKDAVDDIIEKVIEYGGDIEFVDEGTLKKYNRIALIQYY